MAARKNCFLAAPAAHCAYASASECAYERRPAQRAGAREQSEPSEASDDDAQRGKLQEALHAASVNFGKRGPARGDKSTSEDEFVANAQPRRCRRSSPGAPLPGAPLPGDKRPVGRPRKDGRDCNQDIFRFFLAFKRIERKGDYASEKHTPGVDKPKLLAEFTGLTGPMKFHWVHMFELWHLYERQQLARSSPATDARNARRRRRAMLLEFYYLDIHQQQMLVDDWIVERTARQRSRAAANLEACLARKTLLRIKSDILAMLANIDFVLRDGLLPRRWTGAFPGI
jgi:hypothetical protein